ncbi:MAG: hypothetical protein AAFU77_16180 [Myxococcota bacterium]
MTSKTRIETRERTLTETEEKVVRMRHGLAAPADLELEFLDEAHPELADTLRAIEERAIAAVAPRSNEAKRKIVSALRKRR